ncbi:hypothetical protein KC614_01560 [candidate division WWE3 bacterium]|uniref:Uncharacterized protein n=1 Tax=candidate division WWE3 bacterium TaxID=2053526 RepID=A0A955LJY3_UNCKA|nr:hypothetical protein [candidate division WWE3 bacterium]
MSRFIKRLITSRFLPTLSALVFALLVVAVKDAPVFAVDCLNGSVSPPVVNVGDNVTVTADGCDPPGDHYAIQFYAPDGTLLQTQEGDLGIGNTSISYVFVANGVFSSPGTYGVTLTYPYPPGGTETGIGSFDVTTAGTGTCTSTSLSTSNIVSGDPFEISGSGCNASSAEFRVHDSNGGYQFTLATGYAISGNTYTTTPFDTDPSTTNFSIDSYEIRVYYDGAGSAKALLPLVITATPSQVCSSTSWSPNLTAIGSDIVFSASGCPPNVSVTDVWTVDTTIYNTQVALLTDSTTDINGAFSYTIPIDNSYSVDQYYTLTYTLDNSAAATAASNFRVVGYSTPPGLLETINRNAYAVQCPNASDTYFSIFDACLDFGGAIGTLITWIMILGTLITGVKLAIGAIQMLFSGGDPAKLESARDTLTDAFLGLTFMVIAWVIFGYLNQSFPAEWQINLGI